MTCNLNEGPGRLGRTVTVTTRRQVQVPSLGRGPAQPGHPAHPGPTIVGRQPRSACTRVVRGRIRPGLAHRDPQAPSLHWPGVFSESAFVRSYIFLRTSTRESARLTTLLCFRGGVGLRERNSHAYRNDAVGQHPFEYWSCHFTAPECNGLLHGRATPD